MECLNLIKEALLEIINKYCDSLLITIFIMLIFNLIDMNNSLWFIFIFSTYAFIKKIIQFIYNKYQNKQYDKKFKNNQIEDKQNFIKYWLFKLKDDKLKNIKLLYLKSTNNIIKRQFDQKSNKIFDIILDIQQHYYLYNNLICDDDIIYYINHNNIDVVLFKIQQINNTLKLEFIDNDFINILKNNWFLLCYLKKKYYF